MSRRFSTADGSEIASGRTTDVYFQHARDILRSSGMAQEVVAEFSASSLPGGRRWGIFAGEDEMVDLFTGVEDMDLYTLPNGTLFRPKDVNGVNVPVAVISGKYTSFCLLETPALGLICQASGIATTAAVIRSLVMDRVLLSFGIRRVHPAIAPFVDKYAYIGGCDGVSGVLGAEMLSRSPSGTMPHALILMFGDAARAFKAFDEVVPEDVPRIALVDTLSDEKSEATIAARTLGDRLAGVRLDTHASRRGRFEEIVAEVRWELDLRGYDHVKIAVSGGLNEENIPPLRDAGADVFGVGTSISNAPAIDFSMDIVQVEDRPVAKRGKFAGRKQVFRCGSCFRWRCTPYTPGADPPECRICGEIMEPMLRKSIDRGRRVEGMDDEPEHVRARVLEQIARMRAIDEALRGG